MTVASEKKPSKVENTHTHIHTHTRVVLFWQFLVPSKINQIFLAGERDVLDHAIDEATGCIMRFN